MPALLLALTPLWLAACGDDTTTAGDGGADARAGDARGEGVRTDAAIPDTLQRPDTLVQPTPQLGQLTMVVNLGDSIAAGYGVKTSYSHLLMQNDDTAFPDFAGKDLAKRFPAATLVDKAFSGATSSQLVGQLSGVPDNPSGTTLVLVSAGGNDLLFNIGVIFDSDKVKAYGQSVAANIQKVVDFFADKKRYPDGAIVLFFNVYDPSDGLGTIPDGIPVIATCAKFKDTLNLVGSLGVKHLGLFDKELANYAATVDNAYLVDVHGEFLGHGYHYQEKDAPFYDAADPSLWFSYDCIHPNQAGHGALRRLLWRQLGL